MPIPQLTRRDLFLLLLITALAFFLRLYRLDSLPPGLHHDEALNGLEAHELLTTGARPIYIGSGFNGEPLLEYSIMLSEAVFGVSPFAVRLPSALYGALTIPIVFGLAWSIFTSGEWRVTCFARDGSANPKSPLAIRNSQFASFILATLYWHINASREGYKPVLLPLFGALTFWLLIKSLTIAPDHSSLVTCEARHSSLVAGVVLGLGLYTYPSIRFLYPVVAAYVIFLMLLDRTHIKEYFLRATTMAVIALLVFAPLGVYYVQHPDAFFTRAEQVSVFATRPNNVASAIAENVLKVAGMFFVRGDTNPRHNLPGRPAFDWILSVGFLVGLAPAVWHWKRPTNFLLLAWLLAMLLPSIVTEAAPNFLRSLGATVPAVLLVVLGFDFILAQLQRFRLFRLISPYLPYFPRLPHLPHLPHLPYLLLLISSALSLNAYFNDLAHDPRTWSAFDVGLVKIGEVVRAAPADEPIYLTPIDAAQATIQFELGSSRANFKSFDGRHCLLAPPSSQPATMIVVHEDFRTLDRLRSHWPQGQLTQTVNDFAGREYLSVFRLPAQAWNLMPRVPLGKLLGQQVELAGYTLQANRIEAGQGVPLILFWRAQQAMQKDYIVFSHLLGSNNPRTNTPLWGQRDQQPCGGSYPTSKWSVDELIAEDFNLVVDKDAPAGQYQIEVGLYELPSGARLKLAEGAERVLLGPVEIFRK